MREGRVQLGSLPYLEASLEDFDEAILKSVVTSPRNKRHSVLLLEEAFEFLFYQKLVLLGIDVYRSGQDTIGTDRAIQLIKERGITPLFLNEVRKVQKLRGDAKHHAQVPTDKEYVNLLQKVQVSYSAFLFENFWDDLGNLVFDIAPIQYSEALRIHGEYLRAHQILVASQQLDCACIHKLKELLADRSVVHTWRIQDLGHLAPILEGLIRRASAMPVPSALMDSISAGMRALREAQGAEDWAAAYSESIRIYGLIDELLPSHFDLKIARKITSRLVAPVRVRLGSRSWSTWSKSDSPRTGDLQKAIQGLLKESSQVASRLGPPTMQFGHDEWHEQGWELAVFDGERWHSALLLGDYRVSLETGDFDDPLTVKRRESVIEAIYDELLKADNE